LRTTPCGSTRNVERSQYIVPFHSDWATPSAPRSFFSVSASSSIVNANLLQKDLCEATSSSLSPTTTAPAASKSAFVAVNDLPWMVQPGVSSFG
jgi:hypothetical protein